MAHITGGGLLENIPRVLPEGLGADLDAATWELPEVFAWLAKAGGIARNEMARTFNCGIGMAVIVRADRAEALACVFGENGENVKTIGRVVRRGGVEIANIEEQWPN